jgi:hypothetical protein
MKCPKCGTDQPDGRPECISCGVIFSRFQQRPALRAQPAPPAKLFVSTGDVSAEYEVLDPVFVQYQVAQPAFGSIKLPEVMKAAAEELKSAAARLTADGVAWARFDFRSSTLVTEIFAYGTAVKLRSPSEAAQPVAAAGATEGTRPR